MNDFSPTHRITICHSNGAEEYIEVQADLDALEEGGCPLYTRTEWESLVPADWEYSPEEGLSFQGGEAGPYNNAKYLFRKI